MAFPWAPLISAGAGLLGKIFGGDDQQKTTSEIDYVKLRENAERAGFNPLTALRAGGGAGFTTTHHPALASGSYIADAVGGIADAIAQVDPMRDATAKLEYDLKQATLANIQADTAQRLNATRAIGGAPVSTGARNRAARSSLALPGVGPVVETRPLEVQDGGVSNPFPVGSGLVVSGNVPDLETGAEARYGDFVSIPFGLFNLAVDAYANFRKYRPDVDKYIQDNYQKYNARKPIVAPTRIPSPGRGY